MRTILKGHLEVQHERGVVYFHLETETDVKKHEVVTPLRICGLRPIPEFKDGFQLDIRAEQKDSNER